MKNMLKSATLSNLNLPINVLQGRVLFTPHVRFLNLI